MESVLAPGVRIAPEALPGGLRLRSAHDPEVAGRFQHVEEEEVVFFACYPQEKRTRPPASPRSRTGGTIRNAPFCRSYPMIVFLLHPQFTDDHRQRSFVE
jgi:hypothetical protein